MERFLSQRALDLPPSRTLDVLDKVNEMKRRGLKITSFSNRPATPADIKRAAHSALDETWSSFYTDTRGIPDLRKAIAEKSAKMNAIKADPDREILVTVGAKGAMFLAIMAVVNPGDEVLLPDPIWVSYEPCVRLAGGVVVRFPVVEANGFQPDIDDLRKRVSRKTKLIILNTPNNPTGAVLTADVLKSIAALVEERDFLVLADEVYENYVYDGRKHISIGSFPGMKERTITVSSTSKIFQMFGWRVGWAIANEEIVERMANINQHTVACATSFAQAGAAVSLRQSAEVIQSRVKQYELARNALVDGLNTLPGISCHKPEGCYVAFPNVSKLGRPSAEVADLLLTHGGIQSVAGSAFGSNGEGHIRVVYACTPADVAEGLERLRAALKAFK